jgi:hypothetical protein
VPILHNFYADIDPNAAAHSSVNLSQGATSTSLNLSGTTIDTPFTHNTLGDWAQASSGVNTASNVAHNVGTGISNGIHNTQQAAQNFFHRLTGH